MLTQSPIKNHSFIGKMAEPIIVVQRSLLFSNETNTWQGIRTQDSNFLISIILEKNECLPRGLAEEDPTFKQIIPYVIFQYQDTFFLMQRDAKATEKRLANNYSLGIGGHLREKDLQGTTLFQWAEREFHEEVHYKGSTTVTVLGILNDDSNDVGKVHLGIILLVKGNSLNISIKSELAHGRLCTLSEIETYYPNMETWSQIIFNHLKTTIK